MLYKRLSWWPDTKGTRHSSSMFYPITKHKFSGMVGIYIMQYVACHVFPFIELFNLLSVCFDELNTNAHLYH